MARTAKSADGAKTSTLSVRLTPKMRFGLEMMARLHRESIPDIVSRAIEDVFSSEIEGLWDFKGVIETGGKRPLLNLLWANRPSDRLANIAFHCPELLSTAELRLWISVKLEPKFWRETYGKTPETLLRDTLAECWDAIQPD